MPKISICIPTYEMRGLGSIFLEQSLESIMIQTYQDIEIIISDHSKDSSIYDVCKRFPVHYFKNDNNYGSSSANLNNAIEHASCPYIKILFQDDLFADSTSLEEMEMLLNNSKSNWLISGCIHSGRNLVRHWSPHVPRVPEPSKLISGNNTIGAPSVIMFKKNHLRFNEKLIWLMDCEFYYRMLKNFGMPCVLARPSVIIRCWDGSVTNTLATDAVRKLERDYVLETYLMHHL